MKKPWHVVLFIVLICASFWGGAWYNQRGVGKNHDPRREGRILYYVDPMNPAHTSEQPGLAPCGMPMEPVHADDETSEPGNPPRFMPPGTARITPERQQMIGVRVEKVEVTSHGHTLRTLGRVSADENRTYRVNAGADGWVWEVHGSTTGSLVQKDQLMAFINIYTTDFYTLQQQYLAYGGRTLKAGAQPLAGQIPRSHQPEAQLAGPQHPAAHLGRARQTEARQAGIRQPEAQQPRTTEPEGQQAETQESEAMEPEGQQAEDLQTEAQPIATQPHECHESEMEESKAMQREAQQPEIKHFTAEKFLTKVSQADYYAYKAKLELFNLGFSEAQLDELLRTGQYGTYVEIKSPVTGLVLARGVSPRQRVEKGAELFRIADLSRVWIVADVFNIESQYVKPGVSARISLPQRNKTFEASVTDVLPQFDAATRILKVRLESDNSDFTLRPDMFVDVEFLINLPPAITVPVDAVLDSGLKKTVFIDVGDGFFEPRNVETGWRFGGRVEIVQGIMPGEMVVVSGNFLIDSESRMKLAAAGLRGKLMKDPVCGTLLDAGKAKVLGFKSERQGTTYYFCSDQCKKKFDGAPQHSSEKAAAIQGPDSAPSQGGDKHD